MISSAEEYDRGQRRVTAVVDASLRASWRKVRPADITAGWQQVAPVVLRSVIAGQLAGAQEADGYVAAALDEQRIEAPAEGVVQPTAFAGVASDGRSLATLLEEPVIGAKTDIAQGRPPDQALQGAGDRLSMLALTMIQDAARAAVGTAIVARPRVTGYVRMLTPPSCARCAVLAGRWYRWSAGFARHPRCDCRHIPAQEDASGDLRTDPRAAFEAGQVRGLSKADTRAIGEGADFARVVNMRGVNAAGERRSAGGRLMPEQIYAAAGDDRARSIDLLRANGFLV